MVSIFQLFGLSFIFWTCVSFLRFIFETLRELRDSPDADSQTNLALAAFGGIGVSVSLFFLIFHGFGLSEIFRVESSSLAVQLATFALWLTCVATGAYFASRIYTHAPYSASIIISTGTSILGFVIFSIADIPFISALGSSWNEFIWITMTPAFAMLAGRIAVARNVLEKKHVAQRAFVAAEARIVPDDVAIVIAAHNEQLTIGTTIQSVLQFTKASNVYVGSDGSSDRTVEITQELGAHVDDIQPNRGKAGAIEYVLQKNKLLDRYKAVLLMDADFDVNKDFFRYALPIFDDPKVAAVAGHQVSYWPTHYLPQRHLFFSAYRIRLWRILQFCVRYGQTWKYVNLSPIIPGGCSVYRSRVLKHIDIVAPGLVIEDFNMTFTVHHKKLGAIVFDPRAYAITQEPFSLRDYNKQTYRWALGFFQTMRRHGAWPSSFFAATAFFTLEMVISAALFMILPFIAIGQLLGLYGAVQISIPFFNTTITLFGFIASVFIFDYLITIIVALIERKLVLLLYGPGFFVLRYIETYLFFKALVVGLFTVSKDRGKWKSPERVAYGVPK